MMRSRVWPGATTSWRGLATGMQPANGSSITGPLPEPGPAMPDERKQNMFKMLPAVVHEWDMATTGVRPLEDWSTIIAPVHLIHAADTRTPTGEIVKLLAKTYPTWHVHEVSSGGHMAPLARPDLVNPLFAGALDRTNH